MALEFGCGEDGETAKCSWWVLREKWEFDRLKICVTFLLRRLDAEMGVLLCCDSVSKNRVALEDARMNARRL